MRTSVSVLLSLFALRAGTVGAQSGNSVDVAAMRAALEAHQRQERLAAVEADRPSVVAETVSRFSGLLDDGGAELRRALAGVSADRLLRASEAVSIEKLDLALFGKAGAAVPNALGSSNSDLVFFPLAPCRLADTRLAGGMLPPGVTINFDSNAADLSGQGGSATGCGVPALDPAAIAATITAVNPQGPGNLRVWPATQPVPNASALNYALPGTGLDLANTTIIPLFQSGQLTEFSIRANVSATHVVVDVVGYFFSPQATAPDCLNLQTGLVHSGEFNMSSPNCPAGYTLTGGGHNWVDGLTDVWFWQSSPDGLNTAWQVRGTVNRGGATSTIVAIALCCRVPGR